jgi:hypothetical protein
MGLFFAFCFHLPAEKSVGRTFGFLRPCPPERLPRAESSFQPSLSENLENVNELSSKKGPMKPLTEASSDQGCRPRSGDEFGVHVPPSLWTHHPTWDRTLGEHRLGGGTQTRFARLRACAAPARCGFFEFSLEKGIILRCNGLEITSSPLRSLPPTHALYRPRVLVYGWGLPPLCSGPSALPWCTWAHAKPGRGDLWPSPR